MDDRVISDKPDRLEVCYKRQITKDGSFWQAENALVSALPTFVLQLFLIILLIRIFTVILKPLRQPRVIHEILAGVLLGPSGLASTKFIQHYVFPFKSISTLETLAALGMVYYMFLVGLETDISLILRAGKKAYTMAIAGIAFAMTFGYGLFHHLRPNPTIPGGGLFWAIALSCTNFQELTQILANAKLLHSDVGRTALTTSLITDAVSWIFLGLTQAGLENGREIALTSTVVFILFCAFALRPALKWVIPRIPIEDNYNEFHICFVLAGAIICSFIGDACGAHSIIGAFMFGAVMPKGELKDTLLERVEGFVSGFMLPLFFAVVGLRVNLRQIAYETSWTNIFLVISLAWTPKIVSTCLFSLFYKMSARDSLILGLLLTTKGLLSFLILNAGRSRKGLDRQTFSLMVVAFWFMTLSIGPILASACKRTRRTEEHKRRTIQKAKPDAEFVILACVHYMRNVSGILTLLQASIPSELSATRIFAVHLVEHTGRASAMLIVHNPQGKSSDKGRAGGTRAQPESVLNAFESLEGQGDGVAVHPLTAVSAYDSMHEDICSLAEDKNVILILMPFHQAPTMDGGMEDSHPALRGLNQALLANAPCSVGIFVDRGLSGSTTCQEPNQDYPGQHFAMLFIGGPDDREALAYAWRLSEHPDVSLDVVRFVPGEDHLNQRDHDPQADQGVYSEGSSVATTDGEREKQLDDEYISEFRQGSASNSSITYMEKVVNNGEETVMTISNLEHAYNLYIAGKREGMESPLTSGLTEWSDFPEIGALGDTLVSSSFSSNVSVLIIQQRPVVSGGGGDGGDARGQEAENVEHEQVGRLKEQLGHMTWEPPPKINTDQESFVQHSGSNYKDDDF